MWTQVISAATYYVSPSGNDNNSGTLSAPFATIQKAVNMCTSGSDLVYVRAGTYNQAVNISGKSGITLTRYGSEAVYVKGSSASNSVISVSNSSNIIVSYLHVQDKQVNWAVGIIVQGSGSNIQIVGNKLSNIHYRTGTFNAADNMGTTVVGANPITVVGDNENASLNNILISANEVYNCMTGWCEAISVKGNVDNFNVEKNIVHDITNIGIDAFGLGTYPPLSKNYQSRNGTIQQNTVYNCRCNYADNGGIYVDGGKDISVINNRVYGNIYGITIGCENQMDIANGTTSGIHVRNNFVYNNLKAGIMIGTSGDDDGLQGNVAYCDVIGNTFLKNSSSDQWGGELVLQNANNILVSNNVFYGLYPQMFTYNLGTSAITFKYNNYYYVNGSESSVVISRQVSETSWTGISLAQFKTLVGGDAGSFFTNPSMVSDNVANANFHINAGSPCVNAGDPNYTPFTGELDMDLTPRIVGGRIDIGSDETGGTSTVPVTGVSLSPVSASLSVGATQQLTATIAPSNATNKTVSWASNNTSVATVNAGGLVTAVASGSATITVTTADGGNTASCSVTVTASASLPSPWASSDIGSVGAAGSATYSGGTFTISGSGADIWGTSDAFRFAYQQITGDVTIIARVSSITNTDPWAKAGVMIRNGLGANAAHVFTAVTPQNGLAFQYRSTAGGGSSHIAGTASTAPYWVRLQRLGNTFTSSVSANGTSWTVVGSVSISMASAVYVGMAVTSHNAGTLCTAPFTNVSLSTSTNIPVNITVDGNLSDWSSINAITIASGQTCTSLKVYDDNDYFYFAIAGSGMNTANYHIFLNTDNNAATGYQDASFASGSGSEFMVENGALYQSTGSGWSWSWVAGVTASKSSTVTEVRLPRSALGSLSSVVRLAYTDINSSWTVVSSLGFSSYTRLKEAVENIEMAGEVFVYPNPVSDILYFDLGNSSPNSIIEIFNLQGQLVYRLETSDGFVGVDTKQIEHKGMAIVLVNTEIFNKKFRIVIL